MLSHNTIKFINSLKIKKYRQEHQAFIVEGEKMVTELLNSKLEIKAIYALEEWVLANPVAPGRSGNRFEIVTEKELGRISDLATPNKALAVAGIPISGDIHDLKINDLILVLDGIRDPGNMGTIIRTADWFGIRNVVCSMDCVDLYNPKVIQATMGSFARVEVTYIDLTNWLKSLPREIPVYGALLNGQNIYAKKFNKPGILIIGNESKGISPEIIPCVTDPVFIPPQIPEGSGTYRAESLNASIANAIICYEIRKQLKENKF
jgi:RNA methyltransferase, TrmH family